MTREEAMAQKGAMCDAISSAAARDAKDVGGAHQDALAISYHEEQARLGEINPRTVRRAAENYDGSLDAAFAIEEAAYNVDAMPPMSVNTSLMLGIAAVGIALFATGAIEA